MVQLKSEGQWATEIALELYEDTISTEEKVYHRVDLLDDEFVVVLEKDVVESKQRRVVAKTTPVVVNEESTEVVDTNVLLTVVGG
jgi:hypothetical protein